MLLGLDPVANLMSPTKASKTQPGHLLRPGLLFWTLEYLKQSATAFLHHISKEWLDYV